MDKKEAHKKEGAEAPSLQSSNQEKEMQEKVILYQLLQRHLESLSQNAVMLERRYEEMEATRMALEDIEKLKGNEILVPLGSGLFSYGKITDSGKMLVDAGAGVFMDKDPDSSKRLLEDKKKELENKDNRVLRMRCSSCSHPAKPWKGEPWMRN